MSTREAIEWTAGPMRMACDTTKQLDWLERKIEWCVSMVDGGLLSLDEARRALKEAHGG